MKIRQVVEADLVPLRVCDLVPLIGQEHSEPLPEVGLEAHKLALQSVHEVGILPVVAGHVRVVNKHRPRLLVVNPLGTALVVVHLSILVIFLARVRLKVWIVLVQSEATSNRKTRTHVNTVTVSRI